MELLGPKTSGSAYHCVPRQYRCNGTLMWIDVESKCIKTLYFFQKNGRGVEVQIPKASLSKAISELLWTQKQTVVNITKGTKKFSRKNGLSKRHAVGVLSM